MKVKRMEEKQITEEQINALLDVACRTVAEAEIKKYVQTGSFQDLRKYNVGLANLMAKGILDIKVGAAPKLAKTWLKGVAWGHYEKSNGNIRTDIKKSFDLPQTIWVNTSDVTEECCDIILQKMGYNGYESKDMRVGNTKEVKSFVREVGSLVIHQEVAGWSGFHSEIDSVQDYSFYAIEPIDVPYVPIYIVDKQSTTPKEWLIGFVHAGEDPCLEMLDLVARAKDELHEKERAENVKRQEKKKKIRKTVLITFIVLIIIFGPILLWLFSEFLL